MERKNIIAFGLATLALTSCEYTNLKNNPENSKSVIKTEDPTKISGVSKEALPIPKDFDKEKNMLTSLLLSGLRNNLALTKKPNGETETVLRKPYSNFETIIGENTKCEQDKGLSGGKSDVRCINGRDWYEIEASSSPDGRNYGVRVLHRQIIPQEIWKKQSTAFKNAKLNDASYSFGRVHFSYDGSNSMMNKTHTDCNSQLLLNYNKAFGYIDTNISNYNPQKKSEALFGISNIQGDDLISNANRILSTCMRKSRD
jgi:hypothetical protein